MKILITNDDGINAPGLGYAEKIARRFTEDVWTVAPETDNSGLAHSLTLSNPIRLRKLEDRKFAINGTPTDCVIMGVRELMGDTPDLVISGVNSGHNIADDITYSGTVAGAIEGALLGIKSVALSQAYNYLDGARHVKWETAEQHAPEVIDKLMKCDFPPKSLININFPNCDPAEVKGASLVRQGAFTHGLHMEKRYDGRGFPYYWLKFGREVADEGPDTDIAVLRDNRIAVTPLQLDLTHQKFMQELNGVL